MTSASTEPAVVSVARDDAHRFSKPVRDEIRLLAGHGIEGDAHAGVTVQHRSRVARDPSAPNLRQVHLIHAELLDEVRRDGFDVHAGQLGENVLTPGSTCSGCRAGPASGSAMKRRSRSPGSQPVTQIDGLSDGLMKRLVHRTDDGIVRLAGVMAVVLADGVVRPGDPLTITLPAEPHEALQPV